MSDVLTATADSAAQLFTDTYGHQPKGVWSAPGRVNVIGEHVDYAGICLPFHLTGVHTAQHPHATTVLFVLFRCFLAERKFFTGKVVSVISGRVIRAGGQGIPQVLSGVCGRMPQL